jgi:selenocysteine lyase/cysteine desulfurase
MACQRDEFSLPPDQHYLNCAYMSPLSRRVVEAGVEGIRRKTVPSDITPQDFFTGADRARSLFGTLVNANPDRVAIVPSVSYGMAIVARNAAVQRGQNVVTVHHQFPSNMYPWRRLCADREACLRIVPPSDGAESRGRRWNESVLEAIDRDTGLVAIGNVHWTDGTRFDLERISERAREMGAAFVVDGTQSVGAMPFDVASLRPDALVCAAYKWLMGPYSIGVAYLGPRFDDAVPLEETWIGRRGSDDFGGLVEYQDAYRPGAARFDVGENSNFILIPMLNAALEQVLDWGVNRISTYCRALTSPFLGPLQERGFGVEEDEWCADHLFGLRLSSGLDITQVHNRLKRMNISVSVRGSAIRVSPHVYNDEGDMAALLECLCS